MSLDLISGDKENVGNVSKRYAIHIVPKAITELSEPCGYPTLPCYNGMIEKQFKLWSHSILMWLKRKREREVLRVQAVLSLL